MIHVDNHIAQLQLRIEKARWFVEMGKQALDRCPDECELMISHQNMLAHLESLEKQMSSVLHNASESISTVQSTEPLRQAVG
ncbi:hypothetical protein HG264_13530 [Pseudomonas sp. gcc21]|uniref:hypothetical protein n=1 Tax=Pseudomonas sp. gcc21 TaxID=2726989 RepID=UPI001452004A|nr:hypothetical protein [Pseudomonas sp. gcc21]QJD59852.1 hypothetical protein HG264_13530 [Pseudomonas sp. gcc21]